MRGYDPTFQRIEKKNTTARSDNSARIMTEKEKTSQRGQQKDRENLAMKKSRQYVIGKKGFLDQRGGKIKSRIEGGIRRQTTGACHVAKGRESPVRLKKANTQEKPSDRESRVKRGPARPAG